jgi:exopolysaccharide production protein ExoZ
MSQVRTLASIQYLRALAALMVVVLHLGVQWQRLGYQGPWPGWLAGGVDIFFVISGFIMWTTTAEGSAGTLDFYARRIIRIVPLYWLLTALTVAIMLAAPHAVQSSRYDGWHVLASFLFLPSINPASGQIEPVLIPGWTLDYEMFFYLLFGLTLRWREGWRLVCTAAVLGAPVVWHALTGQGQGVWLFFTNDIVLEFVLGMALGRAYLHGGLRIGAAAGWLLLAAGALALALIGGSGLPRLIGMGLPAAMIVTGALALERAQAVPHWPGLQKIGDASYSLYLVHPMVLSAGEQLWRHAVRGGGLAAWLVFSVPALILSVAAALLFYRVLERPCTRLLSRQYRPVRAARSAGP